MDTYILIVLIGVLCLLALGVIYCSLMLIRNDKVYNFRKNLLDIIGRCSKDDIKNGRDYYWRYKKYEEVTYKDMVYKFWKPLKVESFYKDDKFLK